VTRADPRENFGDEVLVPTEVLGEGPSPLAEWWSQVPAQPRRTIAVLGVMIVAGPAAVVGIGETRDWLAERSVRDAVVLNAEVRVVATSTTPTGGSVWFTVLLRNDGPRSIQVSDVRASAPGLTVTVPVDRLQRLRRVMPIEPGEFAQVTVSVRLDCTRRPPPEHSSPFAGQVDATPLSGRRRTVGVRLDEANLITDVAATTCWFRPTASGVELSGPLNPR
jgi:hypothetical protein